jgi:hypothetical protein
MRLKRTTPQLLSVAKRLLRRVLGRVDHLQIIAACAHE